MFHKEAHHNNHFHDFRFSNLDFSVLDQDSDKRKWTVNTVHWMEGVYNSPIIIIIEIERIVFSLSYCTLYKRFDVSCQFMNRNTLKHS